MDLARKLGIGIVMIVPTFVVSGLLWDLFGGSWLPIFVWVVIMGLVYAGVVTGRFSGMKKTPVRTDEKIEKPFRLSGADH